MSCTSAWHWGGAELMTRWALCLGQNLTHQTQLWIKERETTGSSSLIPVTLSSAECPHCCFLQHKTDISQLFQGCQEPSTPLRAIPALHFINCGVNKSNNMRNFQMCCFWGVFHTLWAICLLCSVFFPSRFPSVSHGIDIAPQHFLSSCAALQLNVSPSHTWCSPKQRE